MAALQDPTERLVDDRINEDNAAAQEVAAELKGRGTPLEDDDVRQFFREFRDLNSWSNLPRLPLPHYLQNS